jgi:hypothetical protein
LPIEDTLNRIEVIVKPSHFDLSLIAKASDGKLITVIQPSDKFCSSLGVSVFQSKKDDSSYFSCPKNSIGEIRLRSLHSSCSFKGDGEPVVVDKDGNLVWVFIPKNAGGVLLIGTDIIADLICYRHGDHKAIPPKESLWGIDGERPVYLFEKQIANLPRYHERQVDFWSMLIAQFFSMKLNSLLKPILPNGVPGAIVITGDDDQAYLEKYDEQLKLLAGLPITYFLHPLTRHTRSSLELIQSKNQRVNFEIHPDALDNPSEYGRLLKEQCNWFSHLTGARAGILRNHGYLNDGYWGHLGPWINEGIKFSSNIPGFDGRALNGSLLPSRLLHNGVLSEHWSIVTAIGDGIRYVEGGRSDLDCANCVFDLADSIRQSAIPGVMVLNLHPQNVGDTRAMHLAIHEVIKSGFIAWNMIECLNWFTGKSMPMPPQSIWQRIRRLL